MLLWYFHRLFGTQCKRCSEPINADTLVMRAKNQVSPFYGWLLCHIVSSLDIPC